MSERDISSKGSPRGIEVLGGGVELRLQSGPLLTAIFSPDASRILTAGAQRGVTLWTAGGEKIADLEGHGREVVAAAFSRDGRMIATASFDHTARIWDGDAGAALAVLRGHVNGVTEVRFSVDDARVVTASDDGTVRL